MSPQNPVRVGPIGLHQFHRFTWTGFWWGIQWVSWGKQCLPPKSQCASCCVQYTTLRGSSGALFPSTKSSETDQNKQLTRLPSLMVYVKRQFSYTTKMHAVWTDPFPFHKIKRHQPHRDNIHILCNCQYAIARLFITALSIGIRIVSMFFPFISPSLNGGVMPKNGYS